MAGLLEARVYRMLYATRKSRSVQTTAEGTCRSDYSARDSIVRHRRLFLIWCAVYQPTPSSHDLGWFKWTREDCYPSTISRGVTRLKMALDFCALVPGPSYRCTLAVCYLRKVNLSIPADVCAFCALNEELSRSKSPLLYRGPTTI